MRCGCTGVHRRLLLETPTLFLHLLSRSVLSKAQLLRVSVVCWEGLFLPSPILILVRTGGPSL